MIYRIPKAPLIFNYLFIRFHQTEIDIQKLYLQKHINPVYKNKTFNSEHSTLYRYEILLSKKPIQNHNFVQTYNISGFFQAVFTETYLKNIYKSKGYR